MVEIAGEFETGETIETVLAFEWVRGLGGIADCADT